ncbi:hypothetical protein EDD27_2100 [Nonomuraea polychroma]|uniref:DUF7674 domain-containing protein n=1 Tax=Nonomuraea polychroma TaxID=46176 RepID=A0A438M1S3_9ACTN|nr:hypothetical protein EDD27_2100 [Nonomuraea polychroma]
MLHGHITDYHEVLPHVLFGDLTGFVLHAHQQGDEELVRRCLTFLALAMKSADARVCELVAVSFVENVGPWDPATADFIASWPDALRDEASDQGWRNYDQDPG